MTKTLRLAAALALCATTQAALAAPVVVTAHGAVRGVAKGTVEAYRGIPYAAPPVGDARWREPRPLQRWQGVRDAVRFGPACYQSLADAWGPYTAEFLAGAPVSENCLTLNVWKPAGQRRSLPVLVFIHGGGFGGGGSSVPLYDGAKLAARGIVVVTINYRVGVFGFLAHPDLTAESSLKTSGNYGLLDQIAALRWVRANIARFGGAAGNVTLAGESAGAASVDDLIVAPLAKGLFHKAVAFSGSSMAVDAPSLAAGEAVGLALAEKLGARSAADLRALPAENLAEATRYVPGQSSGPPRLVYVPHVDGTVLPHDPDHAAGPIVNNVPLLTGFNAAEMIDPSVRTPAAFEASVRARYGAFADRLLALYPHGDEPAVVRSNELLARDRYMAGLLLWARARTRSASEPVYTYLYDHAYPPVRGGTAYGAFHSSGLTYVFGTLGQGDRVFGPADTALVRQWQDHLLAFMRSGDPSLPGNRWPRMTPGSLQVMTIGDRPGARPAVSSPARFEALRDYGAAGGKLGLM